MANFADQIEEAANGPILGVVVGGFGWDPEGPDEEAYRWDRDGQRKPIPLELKLTVQPWDTVRPYLDYVHRSDFGSPEVHAIYAWSEDRIVFVSTYDGSTAVEWIPRHPTDITPETFGGG